MRVRPEGDVEAGGRRRMARNKEPRLLGHRLSPPPFRTRQNRNLAHVCSFACKSTSKLSQARLSPGRRPSPEGYRERSGNIPAHLPRAHKQKRRLPREAAFCLIMTRKEENSLSLAGLAATYSPRA